MFLYSFQEKGHSPYSGPFSINRRHSGECGPVDKITGYDKINTGLSGGRTQTPEGLVQIRRYHEPLRPLFEYIGR